MDERQTIVFLTGAGISAESGIATFRGQNGLWENHRIEDVASFEAFERDPNLVLDFYNRRRRQLHEVHPNDAHLAITKLAAHYHVQVITQNVDDLHERAGNPNVLHLHGELFKVRSTTNPNYVLEWKNDLVLGDHCPNGGQLRPHIVWFGEMVPLLPTAAEMVSTADIIVIVGTSMQVYPAASLIDYAAPNATCYYIDPNPGLSTYEARSIGLTIISEKATIGLPKLVDKLIG